MADRASEPADDDPDALTADVIEAAAGPVDEDKRVQIALEDGRTIVARIRYIQDGSLECGIDDCLMRFETERERQTHIGRSHPDATAKTCPECGDEFYTPPSRTQTYCAQECYQDSLYQEKECPGCDRPFETTPEGTRRERTYCSTWCAYEDRRNDNRPDSYPAARRELEAEGHGGEALLGRLLCALGPRWSRGEVRTRFAIDENEAESYREATARIADRDDVDVDADELAENYIRRVIVDEPDLSDRLEPEAVLTAVEEAETLKDASDALRISRDRARVLLNRLGVGDEVNTIRNLRSQIESGDLDVGGQGTGEEGITDGGQSGRGGASGRGESAGDLPVWERQRNERP